LPRFVAERLELSDDQVKQIAKLEKETKAKLDKILTPEQRKILNQARPPRPGDEGPGGGQRRPRRGPGDGGPPGGGAGGGGPPGGEQGPDRPEGSTR
jgi:hypothetical protein